ncbi:MAG: NUDIX domain-containing protein [Thermaceae bacterium]
MAHSEEHPIPTVGALIEKEGRVLLVQTTKWRGLWGIPGGKVRLGEPLEAALRREVKEEVGLELMEIRLALLQEAVFSPEFHRPAHFLLINYFARGEGLVRPNEEILAWAWVHPLEAGSFPLNSFTRLLLEAYLKKEE